MTLSELKQPISNPNHGELNLLCLLPPVCNLGRPRGTILILHPRPGRLLPPSQVRLSRIRRRVQPPRRRRRRVSDGVGEQPAHSSRKEPHKLRCAEEEHCPLLPTWCFLLQLPPRRSGQPLQPRMQCYHPMQALNLFFFSFFLFHFFIYIFVIDENCYIIIVVLLNIYNTQVEKRKRSRDE